MIDAALEADEMMCGEQVKVSLRSMKLEENRPFLAGDTLAKL